MENIQNPENLRPDFVLVLIPGPEKKSIVVYVGNHRNLLIIQSISIGRKKTIIILKGHDWPLKIIQSRVVFISQSRQGTIRTKWNLLIQVLQVVGIINRKT